MQQYILRRVLLNLLVIFFVATLGFLLLRIDTDYVVTQRAGQTSVAESGSSEDATEQAKNLVRKDLGLDKPLLEQYWIYLSDLAQLDLGESFQARDDVTEEIGNRLGPSLELGLLQIMRALVVALPIGIISAIRQDSLVDYVVAFVLDRVF